MRRRRRLRIRGGRCRANEAARRIQVQKREKKAKCRQVDENKPRCAELSVSRGRILGANRVYDIGRISRRGHKLRSTEKGLPRLSADSYNFRRWCHWDQLRAFRR